MSWGYAGRLKGETGAPGAPGTRWFHGNGTPSVGFPENIRQVNPTDFYLDEGTGYFYEYKGGEPHLDASWKLTAPTGGVRGQVSISGLIPGDDYVGSGTAQLLSKTVYVPSFVIPARSGRTTILAFSDREGYKPDKIPAPNIRITVFSAMGPTTYTVTLKQEGIKEGTNGIPAGMLANPIFVSSFYFTLAAVPNVTITGQ